MDTIAPYFLSLLVAGVYGNVVVQEVPSSHSFSFSSSPPYSFPSAPRDVTLGDRNNCQPGDTSPPNRIDTTERVARLRTELLERNLDAYIIPTDDDHQNEFVGESDKRRRYISGFSGSAGTAVVLREASGQHEKQDGPGYQAVWTDGRYFLQADDEMDCNWLLMKAGMAGTPGIVEWLLTNLPPGSRVGADPALTAASTWLIYHNMLQGAFMELVAEDSNLIDIIWDERPPYPTDPAFPLELKYTGKSWEDKVDEVRSSLQEDGIDVLVVTAMDEVAWLLNLRGHDIPNNPVFRSYLTLTQDSITLFTPAEKVSDEVRQHLHVDQCDLMTCVQIRDYSEIFASLSALDNDPSITTISISSSYSFTPGASYAIYNAVLESKRVENVSPILFLKGKKNEVEVQGMINAHLKDAVALCDFFGYLENEIIADNPWSELEAAAKVEEYRAQQQDFVGVSFDTISAFGPNAAVIHYIPTPETNSPIDDTSTFLLDSGAQYKDGTTDLTRTLHFGEPTPFQIEAYTRVLMGSLDFAMMVFPKGSSLSTIEIMARRPLYEVGLDYRHGTSHGIGMFLYVHESARYAYEEGFFGSDEPGYYEDGEFGIRLETTLMAVVKETPHNFAGPMMGFEPVAFVPFEPKLINATMLSWQQCEALNNYNEKVREFVGTELLNQGRGEGYDWMLRKTEPIAC